MSRHDLSITLNKPKELRASLQLGRLWGPCRIILVLAVSALMGESSHAQNITATILGTVKDTSQAVMPKVTVTATQIATNFTRTIVTDEAGNYELPLLPVGEYRVTAELTGFKKAERTGIVLQLERKIRVDFTLEVGEVTDTVNVTESAPIVEAYTNDRGLVVDTTKIAELPLLGRDYTDLLKLTPGVVNRNNADGNNQGPSYGGALVEPYTFGGVRPLNNQFYLDGANNSDPTWGTVVIRPSIDALQEFNVKTNQYNAEFGGGGAVVNAALKSGTNDFHGSLFEFLRNDKLDARPFFSPTKSPFRYNQFGGVLGGPLVIPKLYDGHNRTFFLLNYEGLRLRSPSDRFLRVPTDAERRGDFSSVPYQLYDPVNIDPETGERLPFPGNIIPQSRWHPSVESILPFWPEPNMPLNERNQNYFASLADRNDRDQFTVRVDHKLSDKWNLFSRFSLSDREDFSAENFTGSGGNKFNIPARSAGLGLTSTLSARLLNEFRFYYARRNLLAAGPPTQGTNYDAQFGFAYAPRLTPEEFHFPNIGIQNITALGGAGFSYQIGPNETWGLSETLTWIRGSHSFKMGFQGERYYNKLFFLVDRSWSFNGLFTGLIRGGQFVTNGYGFADFLLGHPSSEAFMPILPEIGREPIRNIDQSLKGFFQDDWKVSSRLTINWGLRYEYNMPPIEERDRTTIGDITSLTSLAVYYPQSLKIDDQFLSPQFSQDTVVDNQVVPAGSYFSRLNARRLWEPDKNNFQPRIGLAFRPSNNDKTAIRAAYGLFNGKTNGSIFQLPGYSPPFFFFAPVQSDETVPPTLTLGDFPATSYSPEGIYTFYLLPRHYPDPFVQNWTLSIQRELTPNTKVEAAYQGSKTNNLFVTPILNARKVPGAETGGGCPEPCPVPRPFPRPFPWLGEDRSAGPFGWANYHGLQLNLERRFSQGLTFLTNFTWSKSLTFSACGGGDFTTTCNEDQPQNLFNLRAEKGRAMDSIGKRFLASWVYELPFGPNKRFLANGGPLVKALASGWEVTGILEFQGGFPFTARVLGDISGTGLGRGRASRVADGNLPANQRTVDGWFDTKAFEIPALNTFGNAGNGILDGPGIKNLDLGLFRNFRVREAQSIQFRAEFFNATNHPNFGLPDYHLNSSNFGKILYTSTRSRSIQFALKYVF